MYVVSLAVAVCIASPASADLVYNIDPVTGILMGLGSVQVGGGTYSVDFVSGPFATLFPNQGVGPIAPFTNVSGLGVELGRAIWNALTPTNFISNPQLINGLGAGDSALSWVGIWSPFTKEGPNEVSYSDLVWTNNPTFVPQYEYEFAGASINYVDFVTSRADPGCIRIYARWSEEQQASPVPTPPSVLLLAPGLAGLLFTRRRVGIKDGRIL